MLLSRNWLRNTIKNANWVWDILDSCWGILPEDNENLYDKQIRAFVEIVEEVLSYGEDDDENVIVEMAHRTIGIDDDP